MLTFNFYSQNINFFSVIIHSSMGFHIHIIHTFGKTIFHWYSHIYHTWENKVEPTTTNVILWNTYTQFHLDSWVEKERETVRSVCLAGCVFITHYRIKIVHEVFAEFNSFIKTTVCTHVLTYYSAIDDVSVELLSWISYSSRSVRCCFFLVFFFKCVI